MGKYEPLAKHLKKLPRDEWDASFEEIEDVLDFMLPPSARRHRSWWGNSYRGNHSQAEGWIGVGWETRDIDLRKGKIRFEKRAGRGEVGSDIHELWRKAREISSISDHGELERAVLTRFIQSEAAKKLIAMGGSDPEAWAAPRERPFG
jgi:hypothetical protein